ncbi:MAG TPA: uracil-DNA glycosylase family protein [Methylophilaceae bacterium]|nr:uracil-DNA glycosylase family protein [Methylophilaceae bacterium]
MEVDECVPDELFADSAVNGSVDKLEGIPVREDRTSLKALLDEVRACRACEPHLPLGARPIVRAAKTSRILIVGQAPSASVHASGIPWDDASGERLRYWMGIDSATFHDESLLAIIPMGLCYPGRGGGGDNPPRRECAPQWQQSLLQHLPDIRLTLLIGQYAQRHYLRGRCKSSLTETVMAWRDYAPDIIPLPHPSPRNTAWFQRHPWFENEVLPALRERVKSQTGEASRQG